MSPRLLAWVRLLTPLVCMAATVACKPKNKPTPPSRVEQAIERSAVMPEADRLVAAMYERNVAEMREWMTPTLKARVGAGAIERASDRIRKRFGPAMGTVEERTHHEGELLWYSGLVIHRAHPEKNQPAGELVPMLYQFALTKDRKLEHLLVREHWFIENINHPARRYMPITRFHFPARGEWTVIHGGRIKATNYHHASRSQRYAYDLVVKKKGRQRTGGRNKRNSDYFCYGQPFLASASGTVLLVKNRVAENRPGKRGKAGGNGVVIDHGFGEFSALWHAIPGSVRVKAGDKVEVGQVLGRVGNSGSSTGPHIHWHVSHRGKPGREFGLPAGFVDVYVNGIWTEQRIPVRGDRIQSALPKRIAAGPEIFVAG